MTIIKLLRMLLPGFLSKFLQVRKAVICLEIQTLSLLSNQDRCERMFCLPYRILVPEFISLNVTVMLTTEIE